MTLYYLIRANIRNVGVRLIPDFRRGEQLPNEHVRMYQVELTACVEIDEGLVLDYGRRGSYTELVEGQGEILERGAAVRDALERGNRHTGAGAVPAVPEREPRQVRARARERGDVRLAELEYDFAEVERVKGAAQSVQGSQSDAGGDEHVVGPHNLGFDSDLAGREPAPEGRDRGHEQDEGVGLDGHICAVYVELGQTRCSAGEPLDAHSRDE